MLSKLPARSRQTFLSNLPEFSPLKLRLALNPLAAHSNTPFPNSIHLLNGAFPEGLYTLPLDIHFDMRSAFPMCSQAARARFFRQYRSVSQTRVFHEWVGLQFFRLSPVIPGFVQHPSANSIIIAKSQITSIDIIIGYQSNPNCEYLERDQSISHQSQWFDIEFS